MSKKITFLMISALLAALLLSACSENEGGAGADVSMSASEEQAEEGCELSSLFKPLENDENLYLYTGDALDDMSYPEFVSCEDGLLFYDEQYSEAEDSSAVFMVFSPESGEAAASALFDAEFITDVECSEGVIAYCDSSLGYVRILDESLNETGYYEEEADYEYWYVSSDGRYLYKIEEGALIKCDLEDGSRDVLLSSSVSLYGSDAANGYAGVSYVDDETQLTAAALLDIKTGELISVEFDEAVSAVSGSGDEYLAFLDDTSYEYIAGEEDDLKVISSDMTLTLVSGSDELLCSYDEDGTISLYGMEGSFIASCLPEGEYPWYGDTFCIYSEEYEGCFLLVYDDDGAELYFWDINRAASASAGEDLEAVSLEEYQEISPGSEAESYLYERAKEIGSTYGIDILIADQCDTVYEDFTAQQVVDANLIEEALDTIEAALSVYPDGFFEQLKFDKITRIKIELCGGLIPTNENWGEENYNALTQQYKNTYLMVFDINQLYEDTLYHEFSHIIDAKLTWDAYCREDALFSEDTWMSLNPEGFEYAYVYDGFEDLGFEGDEYLYFIDSYSMVSPTEDRARIMEYAMGGYTGYFTDYEPTMTKLEYYCECIRDAFDTEGWPEQTGWEL